MALAGRGRRRPHGAWYVLPGVLLLVAIGCGAGVAVTGLLEKSRTVLGDMVDGKDPSASADLSAGSRYRITVIGEKPRAAVTCAFQGTRGTFTQRFPPMAAAERSKVGATIGLFTAPRDGHFVVTCAESDSPDRSSVADGISGIRVGHDYVTVMRGWAIAGGAVAVMAFGSWLGILLLRRRRT